MYIGGIPSLIQLFLSLTPVLWSPSNWASWAMMVTRAMSASDHVPDYTLLDDLHAKEAFERCLTDEAKRNATLTGLDEISGCYGPGAYLAWLVTAYVAAFSSIWHSKCARGPEAARKASHSDGFFTLPRLSSDDPADTLDGETVAALVYPLVALVDVFVRLVRCKIGAQRSAAMFVLFSALMVFGPTSRLSWQVDGVKFEPVMFPNTNRSWAWKLCGLLVHSFVITLIGEPYAYTLELVIPVYVMLFVVMLYALVHGERLDEEYPYRTAVYRPRAERAAVFGMIQAIFLIGCCGKDRILSPGDGATLWDRDQIGALATFVVALLFSRMSGAASLVATIHNRWQAFSWAANDGPIDARDGVLRGAAIGRA
jgi:hypothetical protein